MAATETATAPILEKALSGELGEIPQLRFVEREEVTA